jgi:hypothetical protein
MAEAPLERLDPENVYHVNQLQGFVDREQQWLAEAHPSLLAFLEPDAVQRLDGSWLDYYLVHVPDVRFAVGIAATAPNCNATAGEGMLRYHGTAVDYLLDHHWYFMPEVHQQTANNLLRYGRIAEANFRATGWLQQLQAESVVSAEDFPDESELPVLPEDDVEQGILTALSHKSPYPVRAAALHPSMTPVGSAGTIHMHIQGHEDLFPLGERHGQLYFSPTA